MRFKDKIVLVTGGNSGIGRGIVHRFIQEGARVAFAGRDAEKGQRVEAEAAEMGGSATFFACDLAEEEAAAALLDKVGAWGRLDVVVNNVGAGSRRSGIDPSDPPGARWNKMRGPNLDSAYFVSSYALPLLRDSGGGAIVNLSSTATLHGNWGLYGVAKAAVEALTRSLAVEGAPHGIRANCISPGWIARRPTPPNLQQALQAAHGMYRPACCSAWARLPRSPCCGLPGARGCFLCHRPDPCGRWWTLDCGLYLRCPAQAERGGALFWDGVSAVAASAWCPDTPVKL